MVIIKHVLSTKSRYLHNTIVFYESEVNFIFYMWIKESKEKIDLRKYMCLTYHNKLTLQGNPHIYKDRKKVSGLDDDFHSIQNEKVIASLVI